MEYEIYEVNICLDYMHGDYCTIKEMYVPSLALGINEKAVFVKGDPDRYTYSGQLVGRGVISESDQEYYRSLAKLAELEALAPQKLRACIAAAQKS